MLFRLLCAVMVCFPLISMAQTEPSITVSGAGTTVSTPDQFSFTAVVEERGESVSKLHTAVNAKVALIVNQLVDAGVEQRHIQSMQISLNPWYERTPAGTRQNGFVLSRQINVTVKDLELYAGIVDRVLKAGAARFENFAFSVAEPEKDYQRALQRAVDNAKQRAKILAKQPGVEVAHVLTITEQGGFRPMPMQRTMMMSESSQTDLPGQVVTNSNVQVVFAIKRQP